MAMYSCPSLLILLLFLRLFPPHLPLLQMYSPLKNRISCSTFPVAKNRASSQKKKSCPMTYDQKRGFWFPHP